MGNAFFEGDRAPVLFLHTYASLPSEPIPFESEHLEWYRPCEITELQANMRFDFRNQINELFRRVRPGSAALGDVLQYLQRNELNLFRVVTDADNNQMPLAQMHPRDQVKGFWAVITKRTNSRSLSSLYRAVDLFNHVLAGILSGTKGEAGAVIKTVEEFAPTIMTAAEDLLWRPEATNNRGTILSGDEVSIQELREDLKCLRHVIRRSGWSSSADRLERFLSLADLVRDHVLRKNEAADLR